MSKQIIICGADVVGRKMLDALRDAGLADLVEGFTDYDQAKTTTLFCGLPVYPIQNISKPFPDAQYIISVMSIKDVVDSLSSQGISKWTSAGILLDEVDTKQTSPDYIIDEEKYQIESCKIAHRAYLTPEYTFLRSIDVVITERCSLKCRDCSNLMPYFVRPKNFKLEDIFRDIDRMLECSDEILEARVLGGDAFMHPDWADVVNYLTASGKVRRVVVYTNGRIVPKKFDLLLTGNVIFSITDYGKLSDYLDILSEVLTEEKLWHRINRVTEWVDCASIHKHNRTNTENNKLFRECVATNLATMVDGKVFRCPYAASLYLLGVRTDEKDYVNLATANRKILGHYIESEKAMSACDYCTSRILSNKIAPAIQTKKILNMEAE